MKPTNKSEASTEASVKVAHILTEHKKPFKPMAGCWESLFRDHQNKRVIRDLAYSFSFFFWTY